MSNLTQVAFYTRKILKYGAISLIIFLVGRVVLNFSLDLWQQLNPPAPAPPTVSFGKLPAIEFPEKERIGGLQFTLETPTGSLPEFPDKLPVYFIPYLRPNLLALERAEEQAELMGFSTKPKPITEKIYQWTRDDNPLLSLKMDIFSGSFTYIYQWQNDPTVLSAKTLPGKEGAKEEAKAFIQRAQALEDDLANGRMEVNYLKAVSGRLVTAVSPSEANFAQIEMFRQDINDFPILTPDPDKGIVTVLISGLNHYDKRIVEVEFNYFPLKYDSSATYPLKPAQTAWQELKNGQGYIANWQGTGTQIIIRRVYLAYFDSFTPQKFLQPIVVFEGDDNFFAFVPAISREWNL